MTEQEGPPVPRDDGSPTATSLQQDGRAQMALPFVHRRKFDMGSFVPAPSNAHARTLVMSGTDPHAWPEGRLLLWGGAGCGKTHMLSLWATCHNALLVDMAQGQMPDIMEIVEHQPPALALDSVVVNECDELPLLRLINLSRERRMPLLMASRLPPSRWQVSLPDLNSRLRATMAVEIMAAEDVLLERLMFRLLAERQLTVSHRLTEWLLQRLPREAAAVLELVERIDALTLASGVALDRRQAEGLLRDMRIEI
ncbi:chromosomal replication initiator DnaA [Acetobacter estunensis]|uniref:chromosomal replication initiator DnaA n=1 Tax=Acetobacter estunensis TaxID=104097 RepID=UPI001C2D2764|nr:chromosomal replication initiator DnaA [Acetobacter estunensis]MBV1836254.1 chromosomal replication initiator DnaA [Acetobacter estunensis]